MLGQLESDCCPKWSLESNHTGTAGECEMASSWWQWNRTAWKPGRGRRELGAANTLLHGFGNKYQKKNIKKVMCFESLLASLQFRGSLACKKLADSKPLAGILHVGKTVRVSGELCGWASRVHRVENLTRCKALHETPLMALRWGQVQTQEYLFPFHFPFPRCSFPCLSNLWYLWQKQEILLGYVNCCVHCPWVSFHNFLGKVNTMKTICFLYLLRNTIKSAIH